MSTIRDEREPERLRHLPPHCIAGETGTERNLSAGEVVRIEVPENDVGVRDGRTVAAGPVAGRTRRGAGRQRAHAQQPALVDPGDRAGSSPDLGDVDRCNEG
jgi:hypothetical protein